ncbi:LysR family transcriptional regulator [Rathayibacter sp. AY1H3]|uniref:LysR family transcriptional regulator n=1 Tax=Rathayibacter sp. AY1H3 TaxID=2080567 RepID=UPI000CE8B40D|nr:LysR family transcriptional regulator [Rathayibacter sp. AY1H3]PPH08178.1 LysR family transcriptional regulator [Rathayibacter sp. AY1H3]
MELGQLRALRELGERGSIAAVAAAMRVSPSSVSQQISALQRRTPTALTFRDGRRTALTPAGRALAAAVVEVEVALERAARAVADFEGEPSGTVSVAAFHSAGLAMFGPLLEALRAPGRPGVALADFDVAQSAFAGLTADHDLVVAHRLAGSAEWPGTVRSTPLLFEPLDLALRRDHPLAAKDVVRPADLRDEEWVAVHEGFPLERAIDAIAVLAGGEARIPHRINDFLVAAAVVSAGDGVALLPRYTTDLRRTPEVVLRPLGIPGLGRHIDCLARPETLERSAVRAVLEQLTGIAAGLAAAP